MRPVVFAVHPDVREERAGKGQKREESLEGQGRKPERKNLCRSLCEGAQRHLMYPRVTVLWKLQQKSPMGKDILLSPIFFLSFFIWVQKDVRSMMQSVICVAEKRHIWGHLFEGAASKITTGEECVCRVQQATCRVGESEIAVVPRVQTAPNVYRIVYICTHCQTTPPWPQWWFTNWRRCCFHVFCPRTLIPFLLLCLTPFS